MIGLLIGLFCGSGELYLLQKLCRHVLSGTAIPFWLPLAKLGLLALCLVPCGLLIPKQLPLAAIGIAASLILGAVGSYIVASRKAGKRDDIHV